MALTDPAAVTHNAIAYNLPRVSTGDGKSAYFVDTESDIGSFRLSVAHTEARRKRSVIRLDQNDKVVANPFVTGSSLDLSASAYLVIDRPKTGFTVEDNMDLTKALIDYLSASTYASLTKILGGQS